MKKDYDCSVCGARDYEFCRKAICVHPDKGDTVIRLIVVALCLIFAVACLVLWSWPR